MKNIYLIILSILLGCLTNIMVGKIRNMVWGENNTVINNLLGWEIPDIIIYSLFYLGLTYCYCIYKTPKK